MVARHVLLISSSATGTGITALKAELEAQGHTVTTSSSVPADLAALSLTGVDLIATILAVRTDVGPWLRDRWAEGYPILLCGVDSGSTNFDANSVAKDLGLIASPYAVSTSSAFPDTNKLTNIVAHPITAGLTPGSTVTVHTDRVWSTRDRGTPAGTMVARSTVTGYTPGDGIYMTALETGDALLAASVRPGSTAPARAVFAGWVYPSIPFAATGKTLIGQTVEWLTTAPPSAPIEVAFSGTGELSATAEVSQGNHLLLITGDITNAADVNTKAALESKGHTVTYATDYTTASLAGVDIIGTLRVPRSAGLATWLRDRWAEGFPLLIGGPEVGTTDGGTVHLSKDIGLTSQSGAVNTHGSTNIRAGDARFLRILSNHPCVEGWTVGDRPQAVVVGSWYVQQFTATSRGTEICDIRTSAESTGAYGIHMIAYESGEQHYETAPYSPGLTAPARAVFCGWLYGGQGDYTADGKTVLDQTVRWLAEAEQLNADFAGAGDLSVDGIIEHHTATAAFTGAGVLDAGPFSEHRVHDQVGFTGSGQLAAAMPERIVVDQADFTGSGQLVASLPELTIVDLAEFTGAGQLSATMAERIVVDLATFTGTGQLTAERFDHIVAGPANFTGAGQLASTGEIPPPVEPLVEVRTVLRQAPGSVLVSLAELEPDQTVTVNIIDDAVDNPVLVTETGEEGSSEFTIPVPTLLAGSYVVEILIGSTMLLAELVVLTGPLDSTPEPDEFAYVAPPPFDAEHIDEVQHPRHWKFHDPVTGREFSFRHNPAEWSGIERPGWFEFDASTAPDGQVLTWQAAGRGEPFEFRGYLDRESDYDEFAFWSRLRRRFWLRDHRNRYWLIMLEQFDPRRRVVPNKPWAHDYTVKAIQFMGPVNPTRWDREFEFEE